MSEPIWNYAFDTRSTWFFKGKIIYFNGALNGQADWYNPHINFWSHLDYPKLGAVLIAMSAWLSGGWTESLTKANLVAINFACVMGLLALAHFSWRGIASLLWMYAILTLYTSTWLNMGYMDGQLAVMTAVMAVYGARFVDSPSARTAFLFWVPICFLQMIKNEGVLLGVAAMGALLLTLRSRLLMPLVRDLLASKRELVAMVVMFLPLLIWEIYKKLWGFNYVLGLKSPDRIVNRIRTESPFPQIWEHLALKPQTWLLFLIAIATIALSRTKLRPMGFMLSLGLIYFVGMFFIYLITPLPLTWHLDSSADRTAISIVIIFVTISFWALMPEREGSPS